MFDNTTAGLFGTIAMTLFQSVVTIFGTGPIKVWLDIKRGQTSLSEISTDLQDDQGWLHKKLGVENRSGVLPSKNTSSGPRRRQKESDTPLEYLNKK